MSRIVVSLLFIFIVSSHVIQAETAPPTCTLGVDCQQKAWGLDKATLDEYPAPNVKQIYAKNDQLYDRIYRRVNGAVNIHDAPGGNVIRSLDSGFNFVTLQRGEQDGWAEIEPNKWMPAESLSNNVPVSTFAGIYLPEEPLPYPVAWLLVHLRPAEYPGGEPSEKHPLMLRYTLVSLYSTVVVDDWRWYQIGEDQWVQQTQVAKVLPIERFDEVDTERWISLDLYEQVLIAYNGDTPFFATLISSGLPQWATNEGLFHIYMRYPRTIMTGGYGRPDYYYLEEVPWTMYFDNDIALHGAYWHDGFGYRRSHGCVNASITDARLLYDWASEEFDPSNTEKPGPVVYVYNSDSYKG